jgi:hypothetical protein
MKKLLLIGSSGLTKIRDKFNNAYVECIDTSIDDFMDAIMDFEWDGSNMRYCISEFKKLVGPGCGSKVKQLCDELSINKQVKRKRDAHRLPTLSRSRQLPGK